MCQGGNVRSVALGYILKYSEANVDAIALSWEKNDKKTLNMMFDWADDIYVMQTEFGRYVPKKFHKKLVAVDIGPDRWGNSLHPELLMAVSMKLNEIGGVRV